MVSSWRWTRSPTRTSIQAPIASRFGTRLRRARTASQCAHRLGTRAVACEPTLRHSSTGLATVHLHEVEQPVEVEVDERRAPSPRSKSTIPAASAACDERAVGLTEEQVARVARRRTPSWASTLPFETKRSTKPSLLTSANSGCHAVEGRVSPPRSGRWARHPAPQGDVVVASGAIRRPRSGSGACCRPGS